MIVAAQERDDLEIHSPGQNEFAARDDADGVIKHIVSANREIVMDWRDLSLVQRLELFRERAEELRQTRFLRDTLAGDYELKIEARLIPSTLDEYETAFSISEFDSEDLRSFLTLFRRFFFKNDPVINLSSIYNVCYQNLKNEQYKAFLVKSREIANYVLKTSCFHLRINEQDMTPEYVSEVWINGYYFHDNIDHLNFLKTLPPPGSIVLHTYFFDYLRDMTKQILYTSNVVNAALNEGSI
jgi:hypothetical protein